VDGGPTKIGIESTVVDLSSSRTRILRLGPIDPEAICAILGEEPEILELKASSDKSKTPLSPGLLAKHYQPESPLQVFNCTEDLTVFLKMEPSLPAATVVITHSPLNEIRFPSKGLKFMHLSESGDPKEIAQNLFARLREADNHSPPLILCPLWQCRKRPIEKSFIQGLGKPFKVWSCFRRLTVQSKRFSFAWRITVHSIALNHEKNLLAPQITRFFLHFLENGPSPNR
jgi:hypothetical protein